jgi:hypothetical protein
LPSLFFNEVVLTSGHRLLHTNLRCDSRQEGIGIVMSEGTFVVTHTY